MTRLQTWALDGWVGHAAVDDALARAWIAAAASGVGRHSRHARTLAVESAFVKAYPAPAGPKALHAWRAGETLRAAGFAVPTVLLVATRAGEGIMVTRNVGGEGLLTQFETMAGVPARGAKRRLLRALGAEVSRLHAAGFVHGDLVPSNIRVVGDAFVFLDHDRTRRSRLLERLTGRRNLVQLGRFVVPGVSTTDRWRVLTAYGQGRGWSAAVRHRRARWLAAKIIARRCRIDHVALADAARVGFRILMQSGGPFDPGGSEVHA